MEELEAEDSHINGTNLRSAAGNGMHVVAIGHVLLFLLSSCKPMGKDSEIVATSTTAFDTHTQEEDTQDSEVAETQA